MKIVIWSGSIPKVTFAFNDLMTIGAFRALAENGLSIPDDVSIIGCDDLELGAFLVPALTTVR
jgi:LacI family transcriptional regulator